MIGFRTRNSVYYVNEKEHIITGGLFEDDKKHYDEITAIIGFKGIIKLSDGTKIETSTVESYL